MYELNLRPSFLKAFTKLVKANPSLDDLIRHKLHQLAENPQHPSLRSHRVNTRKYGQQWSSRVTGDLRLIWNFDHDHRLVLIILDVGGHSGKRKVYR